MGLYFFSGFVLDIVKNWFYWVDWYYDKLEVYEFLFEIRRELIFFYVEIFLSFFLGLVFYGNYLYWIDRNWKGIYCVDRDIGGNVVKILLIEFVFMLIYVYDKNNIVILGILNF